MQRRQGNREMGTSNCGCSTQLVIDIVTVSFFVHRKCTIDTFAGWHDRSRHFAPVRPLHMSRARRCFCEFKGT